jgi:hypothetical protein
LAPSTVTPLEERGPLPSLTMAATRTLKVDVTSDYLCPFCLLGMRQLELGKSPWSSVVALCSRGAAEPAAWVLISPHRRRWGTARAQQRAVVRIQRGMLAQGARGLKLPCPVSGGHDTHGSATGIAFSRYSSAVRHHLRRLHRISR